jgi:hypothetical protein
MVVYTSWMCIPFPGAGALASGSNDTATNFNSRRADSEEGRSGGGGSGLQLLMSAALPGSWKPEAEAEAEVLLSSTPFAAESSKRATRGSPCMMDLTVSPEMGCWSTETAGCSTLKSLKSFHYI